MAPAVSRVLARNPFETCIDVGSAYFGSVPEELLQRSLVIDDVFGHAQQQRTRPKTNPGRSDDVRRPPPPRGLGRSGRAWAVADALRDERSRASG